MRAGAACLFWTEVDSVVAELLSPSHCIGGADAGPRRNLPRRRSPDDRLFRQFQARGRPGAVEIATRSATTYRTVLGRRRRR